jgi:hypothetical protein
VFTGQVTQIAPLADAQSAFLNPDLKIYRTQIEISEGEGNGLRSGMSCVARIIVAQYEEATYVPVHAVVRIEGQPTVYVAKNDQWEKRAVELGLDNNRMIRIASGLMPGEIVWQTPPFPEAKAETLALGDEELGEKIPSPDLSGPESAPSVESGESRGGPQPGGLEGGDFSAPAPSEGVRPSRGGNRQNLTPEQQEEMRKRFESMSPEEREAMRQRSGQNLTPEQREEMRKRFESMSPEEREAMRQRRGQGRGQSPGDGGSPRP